MDKLIPLVMKLQDAFNIINAKNSIELPQIVVVGAQSTSPAISIPMWIPYLSVPLGIIYIMLELMILTFAKLKEKN